MSSETSETVDRPTIALLWMALSAVGFASMSAGVKFLSGQVPAHHIVFYRAAVNLVIVTLWILACGEKFFPRKNIRLLLGRGLSGFLSLSCLFYGISTLPLSVATLINWSSPVFVLLFSRLFLKERLPGQSYFFAAVALGGLVLLVNPFADLVGQAASPEGYWFSVLVTLLGAGFAALAYVAVRAATAKVGVNVIIFFFTGISTLLSAPLVVHDYLDGFGIPNPVAFLQLVGVGVFATVGQFAMTQGYRFAKAGPVSIMGLLTAALSMVLGLSLFGERFDTSQWIGVTLLSFGVIGTTLTNGKKSVMIKLGRGV